MWDGRHVGAGAAPNVLGGGEKPAPWAPAVCYSSLFVGRLLYGRWHFCDGHQGARDLIQQLIGIFLFSQRLGEQRDDRAVT